MALGGKQTRVLGGELPAQLPQNGMTAAGCTCCSYYEGQRIVVDRTRCPIHSPLRDLSPMGGGPNPWEDKAR